MCVCGQRQSGEAENDGSVEDDERANVMSSVDKVVNEHGRRLDDLQKQFSNIDEVSIASLYETMGHFVFG